MHRWPGIIRRLGVVAAWVAATLVSTLIAANAVGSLRGQVTDVPAISAAEIAVTTSTSPPSAVGGTGDPDPDTASSTTSAVAPAQGTDAPASTVASDPAPTATSAAPVATTTQTTASTTIPPATTTPPTTTTTTTAAPAPPQISTYQTPGGLVTISAADPLVLLVAAVPAPGFSAQLIDEGPDEVRIEFESDSSRATFRARWRDGLLDIDIDEP